MGRQGPWPNALAARELGELVRIGTVQPGKGGDVIAVPGNPLENVRVLEQVRFVMKDGTVVNLEARAASRNDKPSDSR